MGVYVTWQDKQDEKFLLWRFSILGHLIDGDQYEQMYPHSVEWLDAMYDGGVNFEQHQKLLEKLNDGRSVADELDVLHERDAHHGQRVH